MSKVEFATKRLINAVWTVAFERVEGGVKVLAYDRTLDVGYEKEHELPRMQFVEDDERNATELLLKPFEAFMYHAGSEPTERLKVVNPKNVFEYGEEY